MTPRRYAANLVGPFLIILIIMLTIITVVVLVVAVVIVVVAVVDKYIKNCLLGGWLVNVPATCECISGTDLLRQFYVLPH